MVQGGVSGEACAPRNTAVAAPRWGGSGSRGRSADTHQGGHQRRLVVATPGLTADVVSVLHEDFGVGGSQLGFDLI
jgi:hypothetical protein